MQNRGSGSWAGEQCSRSKSPGALCTVQPGARVQLQRSKLQPASMRNCSLPRMPTCHAARTRELGARPVPSSNDPVQHHLKHARQPAMAWKRPVDTLSACIREKQFNLAPSQHARRPAQMRRCDVCNERGTNDGTTCDGHSQSTTSHRSGKWEPQAGGAEQTRIGTHPASTGAMTSITRSLAASPRQCAHTTPATTTRMPAERGVRVREGRGLQVTVNSSWFGPHHARRHPWMPARGLGSGSTVGPTWHRAGQTGGNPQMTSAQQR